MRTVFIAFLLSIFVFQGAIVASGNDGASALQLESRHTAAGIEFVVLCEVDVEDETDGLQVSSVMEELSDYVILDPFISSTRYPVTVQLISSASFFSINVPPIKPPPRG